MKIPEIAIMAKACALLALVVGAAAGGFGGGKLTSDDSLRFVVVGDWGGSPNAPYTTVGEVAVAKAAGELAAAYDTQFTVSVGDNFYDEGVKNAEDPRFAATWDNVFDAESLQHRWYVVAGNHDHNGNVTGEIAYTKKSDRWYFPNNYYTEVMTVPGTKTTARFVFLDCGEFGWIFPPQLEWLNKTLAEATEDWVIMVGHFPVYSIAEHGPTDFIIQKVKPLLNQHKVAAWIDGHDHTLQHLHVDGDSADYYVVGAGHDVSHDQSHLKDCPKDSSKFFWPESGGVSGLAAVTLNTTHLTFDFYDSEDTTKTVYSYTQTNPRA